MKKIHNMKAPLFAVLLQAICYGLLCFALLWSLPGNSKRKIPAPRLKMQGSDFNTRGGGLELEGKGLINGFPSAHKVYIKKDSGFSIDVNVRRKRRGAGLIKQATKLEVSSVAANRLEVSLPTSASYGDYNIYVALRTRFLKSKFSKLASRLLLRPKAPPVPDLKHRTVESIDELNLISTGLDFTDADSRVFPLHLRAVDDKVGLSLGLNKFKAYYLDEGFESIPSSGFEILYLPPALLKRHLGIESESPLKVYALPLDESQAKIDVTSIVEFRQFNLSKHYFLSTPSTDRFLETIIRLSPVFIKEVRVTGEEFVVIENRSLETFSLKGCHLADNTKIRFKFDDNEFIEAQSSLTVTANLGLNDSSADSISLFCPSEQKRPFKQNEVSDEDFQLIELIDKFEYTKLDGRGFAIKQAP